MKMNEHDVFEFEDSRDLDPFGPLPRLPLRRRYLWGASSYHQGGLGGGPGCFFKCSWIFSVESLYISQIFVWPAGQIFSDGD